MVIPSRSTCLAGGSEDGETAEASSWNISALIEGTVTSLMWCLGSHVYCSTSVFQVLQHNKTCFDPFYYLLGKDVMCPQILKKNPCSPNKRLLLFQREYSPVFWSFSVHSADDMHTTYFQALLVSLIKYRFNKTVKSRMNENLFTWIIWFWFNNLRCSLIYTNPNRIWHTKQTTRIL